MPLDGKPTSGKSTAEQSVVFDASEAGRQAEQQWRQEQAPVVPSETTGETEADEIADRAIIEYRERLEPRLERLERNDKMMQLIRSLFPNGITDPRIERLYTRRRQRMTEAHEAASELFMRVSGYAEGLGGVSDATKAFGEKVMSDMEPARRRVEDFFQRALADSDAWTRAHQTEFFGKRTSREGGDFGPYTERTTIAPEHFDKSAAFLRRRVDAIRQDVKQPAPATVIDHLWQLDEVHEELDALEDKLEQGLRGTYESPEKRALLAAVDELSRELEKNVPNEAETLIPDTEAHLNALWDGLERSIVPAVKAYEEIVRLYGLGRVKAEDVREAWEFKRGVYARIVGRIEKIGGLDPEDVASLRERARARVQPDEPIPGASAPAAAESVPVPESELPELALMSVEEYDDAARGFIDRIGDLETIADTLEREGKLTNESREELLDKLFQIKTEREQIEEGAEDLTSSKESRSLDELWKQLHDRLVQGTVLDPFYVKPLESGDGAPAVPAEEEIATPVSVDEARRAYTATKAAYAEVQHKLSVEQRQRIRAKLVGMNRLVRQAELADAVARATEHAPAVAHAALASVRLAPIRVVTLESPAPVRPSRGVWGVLGGAFKLK